MDMRVARKGSNAPAWNLNENEISVGLRTSPVHYQLVAGCECDGGGDDAAGVLHIVADEGDTVSHHPYPKLNQSRGLSLQRLCHSLPIISFSK